MNQQISVTHAQLIAFIRFVDDDDDVIPLVNQFLCCKKFPLTTKGLDIFNILTACLEKYGLSWDSCVEKCTDETPSMVESIKRFHISSGKTKSDHHAIANTLFFLHGEVLVSKKTQDELQQVPNQMIKVVNYIKTRALKSRLF